MANVKKLFSFMLSAKAILSNPKMPFPDFWGTKGKLIVRGKSTFVEIAHNYDGEDFACYGLKELAKFEPDSIQKESETETLMIFKEGAKGKIKVLNNEYESPEVETNYVLDILPMFESLKTAALFASKDQLRLAMTGVLIEVADKSARVVATDAHSLYMSKPFETDVQYQFSQIIPIEVIKVLSKIKYPTKLDFHLRFGKFVKIVFESINFSGEIIFKLIDARYPDYKAVIGNFPHVGTFNRREMYDKVRISDTWSNQYTKRINLKWENKLITTEDDDMGFSMEQSFNLFATSGAKAVSDCYVSASMLKRILAAAKTRNIHVRTSDDPSSQVNFYDTDDNMYLLMKIFTER